MNSNEPLQSVFDSFHEKLNFKGSNKKRELKTFGRKEIVWVRLTV